jgi:hypothetical protein
LPPVTGGILEEENGQLNIDKFLETRYGQKLSTDVHGVAVEVLYLKGNKKQHLQTAAHEAFWRASLIRMGPKIADFTPVPE